MARPGVSIIQSDGNLGRTTPSADGTTLLVVSAVAVVGKFALGDTLGPYKRVEDAAVDGIDAAYDDTESLLAYHHIKDFFDGVKFAGATGTELYVLPLADTVTMAQATLKTGTHIPPVLAAKKGTIKKVIVTRIPDTVGTLETEFEADLFAAVTNAQALRVQEFGAPGHRPVKFWIEGRNFQGTFNSAADLATKAAAHVTIVISQDTTVAALKAGYAKYANAAYAAGVDAGLPVNRNLGRVKNGKLPIKTLGLSNGSKLGDIAEADLETMNTKRYVFIWQHSGKTGYHFNDDHNCGALSTDYAYGTDTDIADKASRLTREKYLEEVLDDYEVDAATGYLDSSVIKSLEGVLTSHVERNMVGEISAFAAYIDPEQDVKTAGNINVVTYITTRATGRTITVNQQFAVTVTT